MATVYGHWITVNYRESYDLFACSGIITIYSFKPRADFIARDEWDPELDKKYLDEVLDMARGCRIEIVNQEMITCRGEAQRIIDWCNVARETADKHSA